MSVFASPLERGIQPRILARAHGKRRRGLLVGVHCSASLAPQWNENQYPGDPMRIPLKSATCSEIESHFPTQPIRSTRQCHGGFIRSTLPSFFHHESVGLRKSTTIRIPLSRGGPWIRLTSEKCSSGPPRGSIFVVGRSWACAERYRVMPDHSCFPCPDWRRACAPIRL